VLESSLLLLRYLCSCGHLLGSFSLCILRLLDYGSRSYHSCGTFASNCYICSLCRLWVTVSSCCDRRLRRPRIYLLCPLILLPFCGLIHPISSTRSAHRNPIMKASIALLSETLTAEFLMMLHRCMYDRSDSLCFCVQALTSSVDAGRM
jgi:hypothetical protein